MENKTMECPYWVVRNPVERYKVEILTGKVWNDIGHKFPHIIGIEYFPDGKTSLFQQQPDEDLTFYVEEGYTLKYVKKELEWDKTPPTIFENLNAVPLEEVRNKLTPMKNLLAMLESSEFVYHHDSQMHALISLEIEVCKRNIEELSRSK